MEQTLASIIAAAAPLVIAAVGETITERAGVINLSLEGSLMFSAMVGFAAAQTSGSVAIGFLAAASAGALFALIVAVADIQLRLNQIAVGFVLAITGVELSTFLGASFVRQPGPSVLPRPIPLLADIPFIGTVFFQHNLMVYGSFVLVAVATWWLFRTRQGVDLRAVGERPEAAHARGLPVQRIRYLAALVGGGLVGVGGAAFTLSAKVGWSEGHTRNIGWIVLAIVIFGGWHPTRVMLGCWAFGGLQIVALKLQPVFPGLAQVLPIAPFPLMIMALLLLRLKSVRRFAETRPAMHRLVIGQPPSALGSPFHL